MPILLDGDILRNIFKGTGEISDTHTRDDGIRLSHKYALLCKNLSSQGFIVIIGTVSIFNETYAQNRTNLPYYFEVYLKVPSKERRLPNPKNIYKKSPLVRYVI